MCVSKLVFFVAAVPECMYVCVSVSEFGCHLVLLCVIYVSNLSNNK